MLPLCGIVNATMECDMGQFMGCIHPGSDGSVLVLGEQHVRATIDAAPVAQSIHLRAVHHIVAHHDASVLHCQHDIRDWSIMYIPVPPERGCCDLDVAIPQLHETLPC